MSDPQPNFTPAIDVAKIAESAATCLTSVAQPRAGMCLKTALSIALNAAHGFKPCYAGVPELKWCGPPGQSAPPMTFPTDFVDRRTTVAWALYRLTVSTPVDEPIFSAQARVTMLSDSLALFSNFNLAAATVISSLHDFSSARAIDIPESVKDDLRTASKPIVVIAMNQMTGFEDVILYTALFNFARAFAAFQTGPWRSLKQALTRSEIAIATQAISLIERRAIERAALTLIDLAWNACWQEPIDRLQPALVGILSDVKALVTP